MAKFKLPDGQSTKKDISKEWPSKVLGEWKGINPASYKFKRSTNGVKE